jgi:hypothetical protein
MPSSVPVKVFPDQLFKETVEERVVGLKPKVRLVFTAKQGEENLGMGFW